MNKYPTCLKEAIIASIPNCTAMVITMMSLNLYIYGHLTIANFIGAFWKIWLAAFMLDFFIVGPMIVRFVNRYSIQRYMPIFRVGLMAGILTCVAPLLEMGALVSLRHYLTALPRNYICALIFQVIIAMPLGLFVLDIYRKKFVHNKK